MDYKRKRGDIKDKIERYENLLSRIDDEQFLKEIYTLLLKHIRRAGD